MEIGLSCVFFDKEFINKLIEGSDKAFKYLSHFPVGSRIMPFVLPRSVIDKMTTTTFV